MSTSQSPFRAVDLIAGRRVGWMRDIPEDVETFMAAMIGRYHELLPADLPVAVSWRPWDFYMPFVGQRVEEDEGTYYALVVDPDWSQHEVEDPEFDFVSSMYWSRLLEEGAVSWKNGHLRVVIDGIVGWDEEAWGMVGDEAEVLMLRAAA